MSYKIISSEKKLKNNEIELNRTDSNIETIHESSDIAETIKELNDDKMGADRFSPIDMKTRLHSIEISSIIAVDALVALDFLPKEASNITRSKKRLSVSHRGAGREEIVRISQGMREETQSKSIMERMGGFFRGGK